MLKVEPAVLQVPTAGPARLVALDSPKVDQALLHQIVPLRRISGESRSYLTQRLTYTAIFDEHRSPFLVPKGRVLVHTRLFFHQDPPPAHSSRTFPGSWGARSSGW